MAGRTYRVNYSGSRESLLRILRALPQTIARNQESPIRQHLAANLASTFYQKVTEHTDTLSRGGSSHGDKWKPIERSTLAYWKGAKTERMGKGRIPSRKKWSAAFERDREGTGELSDFMIHEWWEHYLPFRNTLLALGETPEHAKKEAAKHAYTTLKGRYVSLIDSIGGRSTLILREGKKEGVGMLDGLKPASPSGNFNAVYRPGPAQFFINVGKRITLGSPYKRAAVHHYGGGKVPVRRLWPHKLPADWRALFVEEAKNALIYQIQRLRPEL